MLSLLYVITISLTAFCFLTFTLFSITYYYRNNYRPRNNANFNNGYPIYTVQNSYNYQAPLPTINQQRNFVTHGVQNQKSNRKKRPRITKHARERLQQRSDFDDYDEVYGVYNYTRKYGRRYRDPKNSNVVYSASNRRFVMSPKGGTMVTYLKSGQHNRRWQPSPSLTIYE